MSCKILFELFISIPQHGQICFIPDVMHYCSSNIPELPLFAICFESLRKISLLWSFIICHDFLLWPCAEYKYGQTYAYYGTTT